MPELPCDLLIGPACSEPVQLPDGRVLVACETPARDAIHVYELTLGAVVGVKLLRTLYGGSTDNGIRAQWPRQFQDLTVYQRGDRNVFDDLGSVDLGRAYGNWPVAITNGEVRQAPPTTSQGVFGHFAGRWWLYDEMWASPYQTQWTKLGVLNHAWSDESGVNYYLFKHATGTVLRQEIAGVAANYSSPFNGFAEYPRGCTLADGRILVVAVGEGGRLRVAVSPFDPFIQEEPPVAGTIRLESARGVRGGIACIVRAENATNQRCVKRIRRSGTIAWDGEETVPTSLGNGRFSEFFAVDQPGRYIVSITEEGGPAFVSNLAVVVLEGWPQIVPPPAPQVVTAADTNALADERDRACHATLRSEPYYNARCAGKSHDEAIQAYRQAVSAAILGGAK